MKIIQMLRDLARCCKSFNPYMVLGEIEGIQKLVKNFYIVMEQDPYALECLNLHKPQNGVIKDQIKEKLVDFISGWTGGENLFIQKYGHPKMKARHMHIPIRQRERDQWLYCMDKALKQNHPKISKKDQKMMLNSFTALGLRIQNS